LRRVNRSQIGYRSGFIGSPSSSGADIGWYGDRHDNKNNDRCDDNLKGALHFLTSL
jgi:hypothetical protein